MHLRSAANRYPRLKEPSAGEIQSAPEAEPHQVSPEKMGLAAHAA
jgi:hypothetical protein